MYADDFHVEEVRFDFDVMLELFVFHNVYPTVNDSV